MGQKKQLIINEEIEDVENEERLDDERNDGGQVRGGIGNDGLAIKDEENEGIICHDVQNEERSCYVVENEGVFINGGGRF